MRGLHTCFNHVEVPPGYVVLAIPLIRLPGHTVRVHMNLDEGVLAFIDGEARRRDRMRAAHVEWMVRRIAQAGGYKAPISLGIAERLPPSMGAATRGAAGRSYTGRPWMRAGSSSGTDADHAIHGAALQGSPALLPAARQNQRTPS